MRVMPLVVACGLLLGLCAGPNVLAQDKSKGKSEKSHAAAPAKHDAAWYRKHSKHSAAWYKKHSKHDAAWFKKHSKHDAAWYKKHPNAK